MNELLIYFAFPVATIILSIVLEKILNSPTLVSATTFAVFLIVTFAVYDVDFLLNSVIYTFLSYVSAISIYCICNYRKKERRDMLILEKYQDCQKVNVNKVETKKCNCLCGKR